MNVTGTKKRQFSAFFISWRFCMVWLMAIQNKACQKHTQRTICPQGAQARSWCLAYRAR